MTHLIQVISPTSLSLALCVTRDLVCALLFLGALWCVQCVRVGVYVRRVEQYGQVAAVYIQRVVRGFIVRR